ncbi:hydroxylysine kinase [Coccinella septempunctata]|uniref:hydroxylysine kinase n=1 Tax=Coccinella septempunctata TaxID=41139 RepID=UPI001D086E4C|nr:hydroxylysine kinase [Coccinella septempunctata]
MNADSDNSEKTLLSIANIRALLTPKDVETILHDHYGLEAIKIKELNGYDDKNFLIKVGESKQNDFIHTICENGYVFKVINSLDSKDTNFIKAQNAVLVHLAEKKVCCPIPTKTKKGDYFLLESLGSGIHIIRLLEFIPGKILIETEITPLLCYESGSAVADLHDKLKGFYHEGFKDRNTPWMLANVAQLKDFLFAVKDEKRKKLVTSIIEAFTAEVLPKSDKFERGIIHGDVNEQNILVEQRDGHWHVKGILDFGDSHEGCLLYDVAVTMTYLIIEARNIDYGGYVLRGYNDVRKLSHEELKLLKICICARFCQSLVMGAFTISRDPNNTYVMRTSIAGWSILEELWNLPDHEILERWMKIGENFERSRI